MIYPHHDEISKTADLGGDYSFWVPSVLAADAHSRHAAVYAYRFDAAPRVLRMVGLDATHGVELFALFDRLDGRVGRLITSLGGRRSFRAVGARMRRWWTVFAATGSPGPGWPRYDEARRSTLLIDRVDRVEQDPRSARRRAWEAFVPAPGSPR